MKKRRLLVFLMVLPALVGAGCSSNEEPASDLPEGKGLLTEAADALDGVNTMQFVLKVEGDRPSNFQITDAEGTITREGSVSATAKVLQAGTLVEYEYIVVNKIPYLKGPTGGFRQVPEAIYSRIFDPTGLLTGERSLPNALREVENAETEDTEEIDGVDTYRVKGELDPTQVEGLSLLASGVEGEATIWVNRETKEMARARVPFTVSGTEGETVVTVSLSRFNEPADIKAPV
ncbi:MAG TPA: LppX_LprAFG lipoprotein [Actinomycetota bacterium]|jgi:lipoprotein LprG|nr:LppX_LprAFG lipoprotein [Actinomycetota bacterium]